MGSGQLAVVTGASSGIGLELARIFADDGYDLVVVSDEPLIENAARELPKAFIQSFSEGLHDEFRGTGVSITALMPGATDTEFFRRADMENTLLARLPFKDDSAETARQGYDAVMRGQEKVVASSCVSHPTGAVFRVLLDSVKAMVNRFLVTPLDDRSRRKNAL